MNRRKILGICLLLFIFIAVFSLLFLPINRTPITFEGKYQGQNEDYMQLMYGSKLIHVNIRNYPELPKFYRGDTIEVQYYRSRKNSYGSDGSRYFEEILSIKRRFSVDWGVSLEPVKVTPTGILLSMGVDSNISRRLEISAYSLNVSVEDQWQPVTPLTQNDSHTPISFTDGSTVELRWKERYGTLKPGSYRLCATVSCEGEDRPFESMFMFSISGPPASTLEEAVDQAVYYFLSKEIIDPPEYSDEFERIPQGDNAESLTNPTQSTVVGKYFDQITYSYEIYSYKQEGNLHSYQIIGMCRGYNGQTPTSEYGAPIWLTIRQQDADTFDVVSFKMPYEVIWKHWSCPRFPPYARGQIFLLTEFRDKLRTACNAQVIGGVSVPAVKGSFYAYFHEGTPDANTLKKTVSSGVKFSTPIDEKYIDYTILIDNNIYYVLNRYIESSDSHIYTIYDVANGIYRQMTDTGRKVLVKIYNDESLTNKIYIDE